MRHALRQARRDKRLTQQALIDAMKMLEPRIKIDRTAISKYEHGVMDIPGRQLRLLSIVLGKPMDLLYQNAPDEESDEVLAPV
jgi:transcriptional regulator with XRE-family HTH domain